MLEAPDKLWLLAKFILRLGIFGACRADDLLNLSLEDIKYHGNYYLVFLKGGKTNRKRSFTITNDGSPYKPCDLIRKYINLRPKQMKSDRLLVAYRNGKCISQFVGIHGVSRVPMKVATFLNFDSPGSFTGHAMRRSSATMLVEGGGDLLTLKRHGGWKSASVAESYIEESIARKVEVSKTLFGSRNKVGEPSNIGNIQQLEESQEYFTLDDLFSEDDDNTKETLADNGQPTSTSNIKQNVQVNSLYNKLPEKSIQLSNNTNCTINISNITFLQI